MKTVAKDNKREAESRSSRPSFGNYGENVGQGKNRARRFFRVQPFVPPKTRLGD